MGEFFEDYDPLRTGSISKSQFRRGLGLLGLSKLGQHDITEGQYKLLCDVYTNPQKQDQALWTKLVWDIETGKTQIINPHLNMEGWSLSCIYVCVYMCLFDMQNQFLVMELIILIRRDPNFKPKMGWGINTCLSSE